MHANASKPCRALRPSVSHEFSRGAGVSVRALSQPGPALFRVALIPFARLAHQGLLYPRRTATCQLGKPKDFVSCTLQGITRNRNIFCWRRCALRTLFGDLQAPRGLLQSRKSSSPKGLGDPVLMADEKKSRWKIPLGLVATG